MPYSTERTQSYDIRSLVNAVNQAPCIGGQHLTTTNLSTKHISYAVVLHWKPRSQKQSSGQAKPMNNHDKLIVGCMTAVAVICWALTVHLPNLPTNIIPTKIA